MGADHPPDGFTQTFLLDGQPDLSTLKAIRGSEAEARKKRAHRKSRWGCTACKRRKVKCDENAPCSNCEKRREKCSLAGAPGANKLLTPAASPPSHRELSPFHEAEATVNLLHMELFHHFTQVTIHTLAFGSSWSELIHLAFHREYLMTAILAIAARHLNILNPASRRYSDAALFLLSKSCSQFRADLDQAITVENRDARLGTCLLLHYLSWCDVDFLDSSVGDDDQPLDLSNDQLFLLSGGVRHVYYLSWQLPDLEGSIFGRLVTSRKCGLLRALLAEQGRSYQALRERMMRLYDDPRLGGCCGGKGGVATPPPEEEQEQDGWCNGCRSNIPVAILTPCPQSCARAYISSLLALRIPDGHEMTPQERDLYTRLSFEVAIDRLTLLLHAARLREVHPEALGPDVRAEVERAVPSFPLMCFRPFCEMVAAGETRALAVLYLSYRAAGTLIGGEGCPWWAARRLMVMEAALARELGRRGVLRVVEGVAMKAMEEVEAMEGMDGL